MKKDITICFRTSREIKNSLEKLAKIKRQTLSSVIEDVLYYHLKEKKAFKESKQERRAFNRKKVSLPAFVYEEDTKNPGEFQTGTILDVSLGGLLISVPKGAKLALSGDSKDRGFHIVFTLPEFQRPVTMVCQPQRVAESGEDVQVGSAFVDSDFQSCQVLQKYLI
jgi:hypothetical protein